MYIMAVTFELGVFAIIKNAMIFVIAGFFRNIWATIITLLAFLVCFMSVPLISLITIPLIFYAFTGFASVFTCYPIVKKYLLIPAIEQEETGKKSSGEDENTEADK